MDGSFLRRSAFWGIDSIKKGITKKHINSIKEINEHPNKNSDTLKRYLNNLLNLAVKNTGYYKKMEGFKSIQDFPILNKEIMKENYSDFISNIYSEEDLITVKTSGSYGSPFSFLLTSEKKARQRAEVIYFGDWANYKIGMKHAYIRANDNKSRLTLFLQNEIFMKTSSFEDEWLEEKRSILIDEKIEGIIGFPSAIAAIAKYCDEQGDSPKDFRIKSIITSGESLFDNQREIIEGTFGGVCRSRYSSEELGVLAHECRSYNKHHLNIASYHIEILKLNSDEPASVGELGRVIVTDLFSHAMPLIRYDTGDLAVRGEECKCGLKTPTLESIEGRSLEMILTTAGKKLPPFFVNPIMKEFKEIVQFQFVQVNKGEYILKYVGKLSDSQLKEIKNKFIKELGEDAHFSFEHVTSIPTIKSGKRAYVINEYTKK